MGITQNYFSVKPSHQSSGFTVELSAVVAVLAILGSITILRIGNLVASNNIDAAKAVMTVRLQIAYKNNDLTKKIKI